MIVRKALSKVFQVMLRVMLQGVMTQRVLWDQIQGHNTTGHYKRCQIQIVHHNSSEKLVITKF